VCDQTKQQQCYAATEATVVRPNVSCDEHAAHAHGWGAGGAGGAGGTADIIQTLLPLSNF